MLTAEAAVEAVSTPAPAGEVREWYDPDSVVFQAIDDGPDRGVVAGTDDDDAIEVMKAAGINAR